MKIFFDNINITGKKEVESKDTNLPNEIYFWTHQKVNDELRGYIVFNNNNWTFINCFSFSKYSGIKKPIKKIALILESPHKDEYDTNYIPIRPANGKTGYNIQEKIVSKFINAFNKKELDSDYNYAVYLINPVQYQASCYHELMSMGIKYDKKIKDKVFRKLFNHLKDDFVSRLTSYHPDYIINACTGSKEKGSLKKRIKDAIPDEFMKSVSYCDLHHPSDW